MQSWPVDYCSLSRDLSRFTLSGLRLYDRPNARSGRGAAASPPLLNKNRPPCRSVSAALKMARYFPARFSLPFKSVVHVQLLRISSYLPAATCTGTRQYFNNCMYQLSTQFTKVMPQRTRHCKAKITSVPRRVAKSAQNPHSTKRLRHAKCQGNHVQETATEK